MRRFYGGNSTRPRSPTGDALYDWLRQSESVQKLLILEFIPAEPVMQCVLGQRPRTRRNLWVVGVSSSLEL
jgi:hypothetical protein